MAAAHSGSRINAVLPIGAEGDQTQRAQYLGAAQRVTSAAVELCQHGRPRPLARKCARPQESGPDRQISLRQKEGFAAASAENRRQDNRQGRAPHPQRVRHGAALADAAGRRVAAPSAAHPRRAIGRDPERARRAAAGGRRDARSAAARAGHARLDAERTRGKPGRRMAAGRRRRCIGPDWRSSKPSGRNSRRRGPPWPPFEEKIMAWGKPILRTEPKSVCDPHKPRCCDQPTTGDASISDLRADGCEPPGRCRVSDAGRS